MSQQTENINQADIAAVTEVVRAYYDGSMTGDEAKLASAFHPRLDEHAWHVCVIRADLA